MKIINIGLCLIALCGCQSMPMESGVKCSTTHESRKEITVFTRNGTKVLQVTKYLAEKPKDQITRQEVFYRGKHILDIIYIKGIQSLSIKPNSPVEIGTSVDEEGQLKEFILVSKNKVLQEWFIVKDSLLVPVLNEELSRARNLTSDVQDLFDPKNMKRLSPDEFADQAVGIATQHKKK